MNDEITVADALKAIETKIQRDGLWIMKAMSLLQLVSEPSCDRDVLAKRCQEHLLKAP